MASQFGQEGQLDGASSARQSCCSPVFRAFAMATGRQDSGQRSSHVRGHFDAIANSAEKLQPLHINAIRILIKVGQRDQLYDGNSDET
eukprot:4590041-Pleurochrysis_carterae.AAC.3